MKTQDIPFLRLRHQQLQSPSFQQPAELVEWMGVMQAQDYEMVKWAIGLRVRTAHHDKVEKALDEGTLLRTHVVRPTWHIVSANDIHWLLDLTAPHILANQKWRHKQLELDDKAIAKSQKIIEHAFRTEKQVSREALVTAFEEAGFKLDDNRASHLLFLAELEGILCSGATRGKKTTYALLSDRVPRKQVLDQETALAKLAALYFQSRGPATLQDFVNWSALSIKQARQALEMVKDNLQAVVLEGQEYWFPASKQPKRTEGKLYLLPAFDEYVIGYKDRSAVLEQPHQKTAISINGIFWPLIVLDGHVIGLWKRTIKEGKILVVAQPFHPMQAATKELFEKEAHRYAKFLGLEADVQFSKK